MASAIPLAAQDLPPHTCITGRPCPKLPAEALVLIKLMFSACQLPFQRICPSSRKNFISYRCERARVYSCSPAIHLTPPPHHTTTT